MNRLHDLFEMFSEPRVLDVGTGTGQFIEVMTSAAPKIKEIVGIDLSEGALKAARNKFSADARIRFEKMDGAHLDFPSGTFDVACLSNSLHHLGNAQPVLHEMARVLKSGGVLVINEMFSDGLTPRQLSHRKIHHFSAAVDRELGIVHKNTYSRETIEKLLVRKSGWELVDSWILDFGPQESASKEEVEAIAASLDRQIARLGNSERVPAMAAKAVRIRNYLRKNGVDSCPQFLCVLKQKG
jgi:ubiquinone/menaquinone biosynthesis C-methylase UbiE